MAAGVVLRLLALWSVFTISTSSMVLSSCSNVFIRLQCNHDEALTVTQISLQEDKNSMCSNSLQQDSGPLPPVPSAMQHLCKQASECVYEKNVCSDKNDCVFFVGGQLRGEDGTVSNNAVVTIDYSCAAGTSRIGGVVGFVLVAAALGITMFTLVFMLLRRSASLEDESKYVEFENRLSRSGSVGSEISAKNQAAARIKDIEASGGAEALPPKSTQF